MNALTAFHDARPAMIVGTAFHGGQPPLGLGEPFHLNGGDRLGADGIEFDVMHDHQPGFMRWVRTSCAAMAAAGRAWFRAPPVLVTGPHGAGRTHAARRLAHAAGVPHVILNLSDPLIAASVASTGVVGEALWALPLTVAMAARRCANPVATVVGLDRAGEDIAAGLLAMIEPETGRAWSEDRLETYVDLGEVTWVVQCEDLARVPLALRQRASHIVFDRLPLGFQNTAVLSMLLEVLHDLGLDPGDPGVSWPAVVGQLRGGLGAKQLYAALVDAVMVTRGTGSLPTDEIEDEPY